MKSSSDLCALGLDQLIRDDELRVTQVGGTDVLIHRDHRWILPLIHCAQMSGDLPAPCNIVTFDFHHDTLEPMPGCLQKIVNLRRTGLTTASLIDLCANDLRRSDDDWVRAGMHLGLIGDAVLFGVHDDDEFPMSFPDGQGQEHFIAAMELPGSELGYHGRLSDWTRRSLNQRAWQTLGWERQGAELFRFTDKPKIIIDLDLDCFKIDWRDVSLSGRGI